MAKVYLSSAAHTIDNKTKCPVPCSENTHCSQYMDMVERRLTELGFEVKRGYKTVTGSSAMAGRVAEANTWGADVYYVAHTNAGGGRYSMTMCHNDAQSKAKADILHRYRQCLPSHKVKQTNSLFEINQTKMLCLYDELFFHDNAEDCQWFHNGGMELLAEETVRCLCEICGVQYKKTPENGWHSDGRWFYLEDGKRVKNRWVLDSVDWCYLGDDGYLVTNQWVEDSTGLCYVGEDGRILRNCDKTIHIDSEGHAELF